MRRFRIACITTLIIYIVGMVWSMFLIVVQAAPVAKPKAPISTGVLIPSVPEEPIEIVLKPYYSIPRFEKKYSEPIDELLLTDELDCSLSFDDLSVEEDILIK